uniref:Uncharacterized protein n=1 Tax=Oryza barthii TaxID=65489 RepID=A0A0D3FY40_9ORYZ
MARACSPGTSLPRSRHRSNRRSRRRRCRLYNLRRSRRRGPGSRQSLVSVGTSCGGGDQWSSDFDLTLRQLHLDDLIEDGQNDDADVLVHLLVQQIDEQFNLTVLSSTRKEQSEMPDIGDSDPSVIYVRPGVEVDLDSVIQETIRLTASAKRSLKRFLISESTDGGNQKKRYSQRWSKLLDLKKTLDKAAN